jgi:deoxyhypusine synthase
MEEHRRAVKDISIKNGDDLQSIFDQLSTSGGFESRNLADGLEILSTMINDKDCLKFLSFVAAITSTGTRGIIVDMLKKKMFDVVITTCGALDHDIARYFSNYLEGSFTLDDAELLEKNIHRLGNVLVPMESYGPIIEEKMQMFLEAAYKSGKKEMSTADITRMIGENLGEGSFLYWAYKNNIQIWLFTQKHNDFKLNVVADSELLSSLVFKAKKSGSLMLGGGISKHHTLWWNQYRDGLDYAVYITTAQEFDGSLSGALVKEAISWGKVTTNAKQTTIHAEITTILPFIYSALLARIK